MALVVGPRGRRPRLARPLDQPVAQTPGRHAVVPVVVGEVVEDPLTGIVLPRGDQTARLDVLDDGVIALLDVLRPHVGAHVERFELLDRV